MQCGPMLCIFALPLFRLASVVSSDVGEAAGAINSTPLNVNLLKDGSEDTYATQRVQVGLPDPVDETQGLHP